MVMTCRLQLQDLLLLAVVGAVGVLGVVVAHLVDQEQKHKPEVATTQLRQMVDNSAHSQVEAMV